jgi:hypothetical protein
MNIEITKELVAKIDETLSHGLSHGLGKPIPGQMCVEAAICYSLGLDHSDDPKCVDSAIRALKIRLNDSSWSSDFARSKGMRNLAILQLGTVDNFDQKEFVEKLAMFTCTDFLPYFLSKQNYVWFTPELKNDLVGAKTLANAKNAASAANAAAYAANAVYAAYAAYAANAANAAAYTAYSANAAYASSAAAYAANAVYAAYAANAATNAATNAANDADLYLNYFAKGVEKILINMNVPAKDFI